MSVLNFVPNAVAQSGPTVFYGEISQYRPAPQSFSDPLYVVIPDWNETVYFTVTDWPACHGTQLPPAGNECLLTYDDRDNLRCIWWSGTSSFPSSLPPTGSAGGDLSGSYPNPTVGSVLNGKTPVTQVAAPDAGWIAPTLISPWTQHDPTNTPVGYRRDALGYVHLRGRISTSGASNGATMFTLPAGYRPGNAGDTYSVAGWTGSAVFAAFIDIDRSTGAVYGYCGAAGDIGIAGISFLAEA